MAAAKSFGLDAQSKRDGAAAPLRAIDRCLLDEAEVGIERRLKGSGARAKAKASTSVSAHERVGAMLRID